MGLRNLNRNTYRWGGYREDTSPYPDNEKTLSRRSQSTSYNLLNIGYNFMLPFSFEDITATLACLTLSYPYKTHQMPIQMHRYHFSQTQGPLSSRRCIALSIIHPCSLSLSLSNSLTGFVIMVIACDKDYYPIVGVNTPTSSGAFKTHVGV